MPSRRSHRSLTEAPVRPGSGRRSPLGRQLPLPTVSRARSARSTSPSTRSAWPQATPGARAQPRPSPRRAASPEDPVSRREAWLSVGLVFVVALLVRAWAAIQVPFPIPEDATYYWGVARNLVDGHGLTSNALWSYVTPARDPATGAFGLFFPRPAFEIWLPLPTLLAVLPMLLLGSSSYAATLAVPVLLGAVMPVLAWRLGAD